MGGGWSASGHRPLKQRLSSSSLLLLLWSRQPFDGCWASFWYDQVHLTTGFHSVKDGSSQARDARALRAFPQDLLPLLRTCLPFYEALRTHAIRPESASRCDQKGGRPGPCPTACLSRGRW